MRKQIYNSIIMILCMFLLCCNVFASEDGKTRAQLIQEALLNGSDPAEEESATENQTTETDTGTEEQQTQTINFDVQKETPPVPVEQFDALVEGLELENQEYLDKDLIQKLQKSLSLYNTAERLKIKTENIDKLTQAGNLISTDTGNDQPAVATPTPSFIPTTAPLYEGTKYIFDTNENLKKLTIIIHLVKDENGDGVSDTPSIKITTPLGISIPVDNQAQVIKSTEEGEYDFYFTWEKNYIQMDVNNAMYGSWTIETNIKVSFEKVSYRGPLMATPEPKSTEQPPNPEPSGGSGIQINFGPLLKLGLLLILVIGGFIFFVLFLKGKIGTGSGMGFKLPSIKNNSKAGSGGGYTVDAPDDDFEIMRQIKEEYEQQKRIEEEIDKKAQKEQMQEKEEKNKYIDEDSRMFYTNQPDEEEIEEEEEEEIEELEEHVGDTGVLSEKEPEKEPEKKPKKKFESRFG